MVNLTSSTIHTTTVPIPIDRWIVCFQTPVGLFWDLDGAIKRCRELDFNPELCIRPVPVAEGNGTYEQFGG